MATKAVGARELKLRLGKYLALVRQGRTLVITDRGQPIAKLSPLAPPKSDMEAALEKLYAAGSVTRPKGKLAPMQPLNVPGVSLSDAVIEDREDRF